MSNDEILLSSSKLREETARYSAPIFLHRDFFVLNSYMDMTHLKDDAKRSWGGFEGFAWPSDDDLIEVFDDLPFVNKSSQDDCLNLFCRSKLFNSFSHPDRARHNFQVGLVLALEELQCAKATPTPTLEMPCASTKHRE